MHSDADVEAAERAAVFDGIAWHGVALRRDVLPELGAHVLLHAGPPLTGRPPAAMARAAAQALVFEGVAADLPAAMAQLSARKAMLMPAQDVGVVTPLAQVVSASMPVAIVRRGGQEAYGALVEGGVPALRFGTDDALALARLRTVRDAALQRLAALLDAAPLNVATVVARALRAGDECHARTGAANQALVEGIEGLAAQDRTLLLSHPNFVLPILMAGGCCLLRSQRAGIAAIGGNGLEFGTRLHGETHWRTCIAQPPRGTRLAGHELAPALGAIGDSAVVDACGLGGQALRHAPLLAAEWQGQLPGDALARCLATIEPTSGLVDPARVRASGKGPLVNLAILDRAGVAGLIGRGFYEVPASLFTSRT